VYPPGIPEVSGPGLGLSGEYGGVTVGGAESVTLGGGSVTFRDGGGRVGVEEGESPDYFEELLGVLGERRD
jgi:hypothetical protein